MVQVRHQELTKGALVFLDLHSLVDESGRLELTVGNVHFDLPPGRPRSRRHFGEQFGESWAEGNEGDGLLGKLPEVGIGGELRVEDEVARSFAVALLLEVHESQYLIRFLPLPEIRVGVAEQLAFSVLSEEGQDGLASLAAARHVVLLDEGVFPQEGDGVEIQIEG